MRRRCNSCDLGSNADTKNEVSYLPGSPKKKEMSNQRVFLGEKLKDDLGSVLEVLALAESVSVATTDSPLLFSRACYHLGNRHTEVQIESDQLIYLHDHVLDSMLIQLGLEVTRQTLPFSPENGAYHGAGAHTHTHVHVHTNEASSGQ